MVHLFRSFNAGSCRWNNEPLNFLKRLSEMSGTEPIELIDRNESLAPVQLETDAQQSYDQIARTNGGALANPRREPIAEEVPTVYKSEVVPSSYLQPSNERGITIYALIGFVNF